MIYPYTQVLNSQARGSGVFATRFIPKGTIVWVLSAVDRLFSIEQVAAMSPKEREDFGQVACLINEGVYLLSEDDTRFINHSCNANSLTVNGIEISLAIRDIQADEEITEDYGLYYANGGFGDCLCGSANCRRKICQDDIQQYGDKWDRQIEAVFPSIPQVEQPLWDAIAPARREQIETILAGKSPLPSCKSLKCSPEQLQQAAEYLWPAFNE